jgi:transposase
MELFRAHKIAEGPSASTKRCGLCRETQEVVKVIVDADSGHSIQMFECKNCGERTWDD